MKVKLLNSNGYPFMSAVKFPAEVEGEQNGTGNVQVMCSELMRVGAKNSIEVGDPVFMYGFKDYEIIDK